MGDQNGAEVTKGLEGADPQTSASADVPAPSNPAPVGHIEGMRMGAMPLIQQDGKVFVGPGAKKEAQVIGLGLIKLSSRQKDELDRAKRYAMDISIKHVLMKQQIAHQKNQQKVAMYAQALSLMARVYIGSISFEVREENIKEAFSVFGPIKTINMSWDAATGHHKGFAFLEYEVPEAALLAQEAMNGKLMGGRNLKVGRPSNMPQAQPIIEMVTQEAKQYHRVYVASVHPDLSEQDLRSVFEAFGVITKVQLAKQSGGRGHRGFGYIEFTTGQSVREAIEGMNNFDLGGQYLQVGRCITPPEALTYIVPTTQSVLPTAAAVAAAAVTAQIQAQEVGAAAPKPSGPLAIGNSSHSPSPQTRDRSRSRERDGRRDRNSRRERDRGREKERPKEIEPNNAAPAPRRGRFGGFAATAPSTVVEPLALPPPQVVDPVAVSKSQPPLPPPQVVDPIAAVRSQPATSSTEPPAPPPAKEKKKKPAGFLPVQATTFEPSAPAPEKKPLPAKRDLISRIEIKHQPNPMKKAEFGPLDSNIESFEDLEEQITGSKQLAIGNGSSRSSKALALITGDNGKALSTIRKSESKQSKTSSKSGGETRRRTKVPKLKERKPKLNNPHAIDAVFRAGAVNDTLQATQQASEEASLSSMENVEIRGNDARHMLMHKLMRTNRSSVIVLKNMVSEIDEELEEDVKEECSKFGQVINVVIVYEKDAEEIRIFVRFADPTQADAAIKVLDGRWFGGRQVQAKSYDQILFEHDDFSG